jgi:class 3 adenylate cyclase
MESVFTDVPFRRRREARVRRLLTLATGAVIVLCSIWLVIGIVKGVSAIVWVESIGLVLSVVVLLLARYGSHDAARHSCVVLVLALIVAIMVLDGNEATQPPILHIYLICVAVGVFLVFFDSPLRVPSSYALLCVALFVAWELGWVRSTPVVLPDPVIAQATRHFAVIGAMFILLALAMTFVRDIADAERQLSAANERIETLLENMLPETIARRLREEGHTFADAFPTCTILFADIVGFTRYASEHTAGDVVDLLDRVFSRFDELVEAAGVEKIKTIGDAYMVVAGVPTPRLDHARAIADLALQMQEAIRPFGLRLRIGINTGPVVAGVIGKKRFIYDLWGDAVNVASRMETQARPDSIQVTEGTAAAIGEYFVLERLGPVEVRGRGSMEAWALVARAA